MPIDWVAILPYLFFAGGGTVIFCAGAFWRSGRPSELLFAVALLTAVAAGAAAALVSPGSPSFFGMLDLEGFAR